MELFKLTPILKLKKATTRPFSVIIKEKIFAVIVTARKKVVNGNKLSSLYSQIDRTKRDFKYLELRR